MNSLKEFCLYSIYIFFSDLNHGNDDTMAERFFPINTKQDDLPNHNLDCTIQRGDTPNVNEENNDNFTQNLILHNKVVDAQPECSQTKICDEDYSTQPNLNQPVLSIVEDNTNIQSQDFTQIQNNDLILPKQSPSSNALKLSETITIASCSGTLNSIQSCVRNLNKDLDRDHVDKTIQSHTVLPHESYELIPLTVIDENCSGENTLKQSDVNNMESLGNVSNFLTTLYERQESYHGMLANTVECQKVATTPSKLTYISTDPQLTISNEIKPLHDSGKFISGLFIFKQF